MVILEVLVRPSYVLGGQGMKIVLTMRKSRSSPESSNCIAQDHPPCDKYLQGKEIGVDAVWFEPTFIPGIMEHIERTESTRRQYRISGSNDQ